MSPRWKIFSQKGFASGVSSTPSDTDGAGNPVPNLALLGTTATDPEAIADNFGCCCRKSGDCILAVSIIDECDSVSPRSISSIYNTLRANYPSRNLVVFQPDIWAEGTNHYVIAPWNGSGRVDRGAGIYLPEKWGESDGIDHIEKVVRDDGKNSPDDWFAMLENLGVISTDVNAGGSDSIVITPAFGKIAFFLDTSGSMVLQTVINSYDLFLQRLRDEMGIITGDRLIQRISGGEDWLTPHAVERPDEACIA